MASKSDQPMPLLDSIDDPKGIVHVMPEDVGEGERGEYFVRRVQEIRWELFGLLVQLDEVEGPTEAAMMLIPHAIDLLGVVARTEAAWIDDSESNLGAGIFYPKHDRDD